MLATLEILSLVLTTTISLSHYLSHLRTAAKKCTVNGKRPSSPPPTQHTSPAVNPPMAIDPHPSSVAYSPGATADSSPPLSSSLQDTPSLPPTPFDFARVPMITPRAPAPPRILMNRIQQDTSSLNASDTVQFINRPLGLRSPLTHTSLAPSPVASSSENSSGSPATSSTPSLLRNQLSALRARANLPAANFIIDGHGNVVDPADFWPGLEDEPPGPL
ncbi:hypothetical protein BC826DRAFT_1111214 [Russula brevipes]|nr:hypothetical protein BC826DRAFT_1111214 [Russula brevipes]